MPLQLPNLDDRTYSDLVEEGRSLIPRYAPEWTNHNPSDPGITIVELFAFITEMLLYRLNRITDENMYAFLRLINGPDWEPSNRMSLTEDIRNTVLEHRKVNRAITCGDFEKLALEASPIVVRAHCVPKRNLEIGGPMASRIERPGHVSVVIVPRDEEGDLQPRDELKETIKNYLEPTRLLTTVVHVVEPFYVKIGVRIRIFLKPDELEDNMRARALETLRQFLHPLIGGLDGKGWPFGRDVYVSEIYEILDTLPGVDYVQKVENLDELIVDDTTRLKRNSLGELIAVDIRSNELVLAQIDKKDIQIESPIGTR